MTDEQYINFVHYVDEVMDITSQAQPAKSEEFYTPKMKCLVKNEEFSSFIYLNGGWLYYEKCPVCGMIKSAENHKLFLDNHREVLNGD